MVCGKSEEKEKPNNGKVSKAPNNNGDEEVLKVPKNNTEDAKVLQVAEVNQVTKEPESAQFNSDGYKKIKKLMKKYHGIN